MVVHARDLRTEKQREEKHKFKVIFSQKEGEGQSGLETPSPQNGAEVGR